MKKVILILMLASPFVFAENPAEYQEFLGANGSVNWSNGKVTAEGFGAAPEGKRKVVAGPLACRAAIADAQRNLLEATQGVRVTATTLVSNFVAASDDIKTTVEGTVKGASTIYRKIFDDDTCKVVMQISLAGNLSNGIYSAEKRDDTTALLPRWKDVLVSLADVSVFPRAVASESVPKAHQPWAEMMEKLDKRLTVIEQKLAVESPVLNQARKQELPTGLIVDARGSNFIPSMSPKIRKLRGGIVYPESQAKSSILESGKLVSLFSRSLDFALNHPVVGEKPLLVKALRTWGKTRTEIVLGTSNSEKIIELSKTAFFNDAGVIIVLD